jgi:hypothetical protein
MKSFVLKWYPLILAFICMLYSIGLGLVKEEAFIFGSLARNNFLLFNSNPSKKKTMSISFLSLRHNFFNLYVPNVLEYFYSSKNKGKKIIPI